jgi:hypothetical protein
MTAGKGLAREEWGCAHVIRFVCRSSGLQYKRETSLLRLAWRGRAHTCESPSSPLASLLFPKLRCPYPFTRAAAGRLHPRGRASPRPTTCILHRPELKQKATRREIASHHRPETTSSFSRPELTRLYCRVIPRAHGKCHMVHNEQNR